MKKTIHVVSHDGTDGRTFGLGVGDSPYQNGLTRHQASKEVSRLLHNNPGYHVSTDGLTDGERAHFLNIRPMNEEGLYNLWLEEHDIENAMTAVIRNGPHYVFGRDLKNAPQFIEYKPDQPREKRKLYLRLI